MPAATHYRVVGGISIPPNDEHHEPGTVLDAKALDAKDIEWMVADGVIEAGHGSGKSFKPAPVEVADEAAV